MTHLAQVGAMLQADVSDTCLAQVGGMLQADVSDTPSTGGGHAAG